jgi:hypothetical protein
MIEKGRARMRLHQKFTDCPQNPKTDSRVIPYPLRDNVGGQRDMGTKGVQICMA